MTHRGERLITFEEDSQGPLLSCHQVRSDEGPRLLEVCPGMDDRWSQRYWRGQPPWSHLDYNLLGRTSGPPFFRYHWMNRRLSWHSSSSPLFRSKLMAVDCMTVCRHDLLRHVHVSVGNCLPATFSMSVWHTDEFMIFSQPVLRLIPNPLRTATLPYCTGMETRTAVFRPASTWNGIGAIEELEAQ